MAVNRVLRARDALSVSVRKSPLGFIGVRAVIFKRRTLAYTRQCALSGEYL